MSDFRSWGPVWMMYLDMPPSEPVRYPSAAEALTGWHNKRKTFSGLGRTLLVHIVSGKHVVIRAKPRFLFAFSDEDDQGNVLVMWRTSRDAEARRAIVAENLEGVLENVGSRAGISFVYMDKSWADDLRKVNCA